MTTIIVDRRVKRILADSQNTAKDGSIYRGEKIEFLANGRIFLGSGHCHTIADYRRWCEEDCTEDTRPDLDYLVADPDEYGSTCLVICPDTNKMWLIDEEMELMEIQDEYYAIGSGAAYALGAMDSGASMRTAMASACMRDSSTSEPLSTYEYGESACVK